MPRLAKKPHISLRMTKERTTVLEELKKLGRPATASDIALKTQGLGVGRSSVFRILKAFAVAGTVTLSENTHHEQLYEVIEGPMHHHLQCRQCGMVVDVKCHLPKSTVTAWQRHYGFTNIQHEVTAFGLCRQCSAQS